MLMTTLLTDWWWNSCQTPQCLLMDKGRRVKSWEGIKAPMISSPQMRKHCFCGYPDSLRLQGSEVKSNIMSHYCFQVPLLFPCNIPWLRTAPVRILKIWHSKCTGAAWWQSEMFSKQQPKKSWKKVAFHILTHEFSSVICWSNFCW